MKFLMVVIAVCCADLAYSGNIHTGKKKKKNAVDVYRPIQIPESKEEQKLVESVEEDKSSFFLSTIPTTLVPTIDHIASGLHYLFFTRGDTIYRWCHETSEKRTLEPEIYVVSGKERIDHMSVFAHYRDDRSSEDVLAYSVGQQLYFVRKAQDKPQLFYTATSPITGVTLEWDGIFFSVGKELFQISWRQFQFSEACLVTIANDAIHNLRRNGYTVGAVPKIYRIQYNGQIESIGEPYQAPIDVLGSAYTINNREGSLTYYSFSQGNVLYSIESRYQNERTSFCLITIGKVPEPITGIAHLSTDTDYSHGYAYRQHMNLVTAGRGIYVARLKGSELVNIAPRPIRHVGWLDRQLNYNQMIDALSYYFSDGFNIFIAPRDASTTLSNLAAMKYIITVPEQNQGEPSIDTLVNPVRGPELFEEAWKCYLCMKGSDLVPEIQRVIIFLVLGYFKVLRK